MIKILLICTTGQSSRKIEEKMLEHALKLDVKVKISAIGDAEKKLKILNADIILLGPQIRYTIDEVKALAVGKIVKVINSQEYGLLRGDLILEDALNSLRVIV